MRINSIVLKGITLIAIIGMIASVLVSTVHVQAASVTKTFTPSADSYVNQQYPDQNYGTSSTLYVDGSPVKRAYLRFDVSGLSGYTVASATLKLYARSSLSAGISVDQETTHTWTETGITYNNAPAPGTLINSSGAIASSTWVSVDVTSYISADGEYDFALSPLSTTNLNLASRESGSTAPQLVIDLNSSAATATNTPTSANTATPTPVATNTPTPLSLTATNTPTTSVPTPTATNTPAPTPTSTPSATHPPDFSHVIILILENREYSSVVGSSSWPNFNSLAQRYTLLTNDYAVTHPSLPNYIALTSGSTQGITSDCTTCWVNATDIADTVESSGRTWKAYMESMPSPCYLGNSGDYAQKHNPFVYYNDIRTNTSRCQQHDVPLTQFDTDLANNKLPAYTWITPNLCDDGHDCSNATADTWLGNEVNKILSSSAFDANSLLVVTFDEGTTSASCCGLPSSAGGHIATLLLGSLVKTGYKDSTAYDHYSLLKTIDASWGLPYLGHEGDSGTNTILASWK